MTTSVQIARKDRARCRSEFRADSIRKLTDMLDGYRGLQESNGHPCWFLLAAMARAELRKRGRCAAARYCRAS